MKIAVLGNGSIGMATAFRLAKKGHSVTMFGEKNLRGSGSLAAGAMLNCLTEIEVDHFENNALKKKFELAYSGFRKWEVFLLNFYTKKELKNFKKRKTVIFTNKFSSPYEKKNFEYLKNLIKLFPDRIKILKKKPKSTQLELKSCKEFLEIKEGYVDARNYLDRLKQKLNKMNVKFEQDYKKYRISIKNKKIKINNYKKKIMFDFLVVAMGSYSSKLFNDNKNIFKKVQKIFFGTGFGYLLKERKYSPKIKNDHTVYRTMNRGNACGFHLVPNSQNEYYFGASSTITHLEEKNPRISAISALTGGLSNQFSKHFLNYNSKPILGHRPITADTYPLLGPLDSCEKIIIATGNKRDGFTASPEISDIVAKYIDGDNTAFKKFKIFKPERNLISYFDKEKAILKTAEAKISGEMMHSKVNNFYRWTILVKLRVKEIRNNYKKIKVKKNFGIHPELFSLFLHKRI